MALIGFSITSQDNFLRRLVVRSVFLIQFPGVNRYEKSKLKVHSHRIRPPQDVPNGKQIFDRTTGLTVRGRLVPSCGALV